MSMQLLEKEQTLVKELLSKTEEGKLNWQSTSQPNEYMVAFPEHAIRVVAVNRERIGGYSRLEIYDSQGNLAEKIGNEDAWTSDASGAQNELYLSSLIQQLYDLVRNRVRRPDSRVIDAVLLEVQQYSPGQKSA